MVRADNGPEYLTLEQAADRLQVSVDRLRRWVWEGVIPAYKIGSEVRLVWNEVEASLEPVQPYADKSLLLLPGEVENSSGTLVNPFRELASFAREAGRSLKAINRTTPERWDKDEEAWQYLAVQVAKLRRSEAFEIERIEVWKERHITRDLLFNVHVGLHEMLRREYGEKRFSHLVADPEAVKKLCTEEFVIRDDSAVAVCGPDPSCLFRVTQAPEEVREYLERYEAIREKSRPLWEAFRKSDYDRWFERSKSIFVIAKKAIGVMVDQELRGEQPHDRT